ncbi:hypothetical protein V6N00_12745 [Tersicoccus sp. MR15.9]|uniref:hypothetical protein n=1 Tax=Tersicoccus mangrovi TaxID=3121635 RepID=UPI002FE55092
MPARAAAGPGKPITGFILLIAVGVAGAGTWYGYPGLVALWAGAVAAAFLFPSAMLTGKKDARGYATAAHPGEQKLYDQSRYWGRMKMALILPGTAWMPGLKVQLSFLVALWAGLAATLIPVHDQYTAPNGPWLNAAAVFVLIAAAARTRRATLVPDDVSPGTTVADLITLTRANTKLVIILTIAGLGLGAFAGTLAVSLLPLATDAAHAPAIPETPIWALCLTGGVLATLAGPWIRHATEAWKLVVAARAEWAPRWTMLKIDPAPRLVARRTVGNATIDTFDAPASLGAVGMWTMGPKITPTVGSGSRIAVLSVPSTDATGAPMPGTKHPIRFEVAAWPSGAEPDLTDPATTPEVVREFARAVLVWTADEGGLGRPIAEDAHLLTTPGEGPAAWLISWSMPDGPNAEYLRTNARAGIAANAGTQALIDHRAMSGMGSLYLGALTDPNTPWDQAAGVSTETMRNLAEDDTWAHRWSVDLGLGPNYPKREVGTLKTAVLKGGRKITAVAFVNRNSITLADIRKLEPKLGASMNGAPFVSVTGYPGAKPGERHPQAFTVSWSEDPLPTKPDDIAPVPSPEGPKLLLAGLVNDAFRIARLADRPEVRMVTCLSRDESRKHIWKIDLDLHGGVTLAELRAVAGKIRQHWGSEWLRIAHAEDGTISIVAGASPAKAKLKLPSHEQYLVRLDWDQAFLDSKVFGVGGLVPELKAVTHLPHNESVLQVDFALPPGLDYATVKASTEKLKTATNNAFIEVRRVDSAEMVRLLVAESNPLPERTDFDFAVVDGSGREVPFAVGIDGEPITWDPVISPHALLAGVTRSGKSVMAQAYVYGMLAKGAEVYIVDPMKSAADFMFAKPYAQAIAVDIFEAAAVVEAVYAKVTQRKKVNAAHGVGSYHELPDPPAPLVVLIDEFTSLMTLEPVPAPSDDPDEDAEREEVLAINAARKRIGMFTGKLAREAASAGVNLLLGTQKLTAKMLDTLPGGADIKDLSLDTRLPVPVSEKFPTGWARNEDLQIGDLLYTPSGRTTPIIQFSETFTDNDVYAVTFDDGQTVKAGGGHLWIASDAASRRKHDRTGAVRRFGPERIQQIRALAETVEDGALCTPAELAAMVGYAGTGAIERIAVEYNLTRFHLDHLGSPTPYIRPRGTAPVSFDLAHAKTTLTGRPGAEALETLDRPWATAREIAETMAGRPVSPSTAGNLGQTLKASRCPARAGHHPGYSYRTADALRAVAEHWASMWGRDRATGAPTARERLVTTEEMADALATNPKAGWAIRNAAAFDGPDLPLPIDPYVLGAWLGDGSSGSGIITSSAAASCTDSSGLTDQEHMLAQLTAAGFDPRVLACSDQLIGTRGLKGRLRALGVLHDKHIPAAYQRASRTQRITLLQGLMDTDGTLSTSGHCYIGQVNRTMAEGILELARGLGLKPGWSEWPAGYTPAGATEKKITGTVYTVSFGADFPAFRLARKAAKQKPASTMDSTRRRAIVSIDRVETEPTRCIAVADEEHLFLVEGFIPTHNTNLARTLLGSASPGDRMSALRDFESAPPMGTPIPKGRGLWEPLDHSAVLMQVWYASQERFTAELASRLSPLSEAERTDIAPFLRRPAGHDRPLPHDLAPVEPTVIDLGDLDLDLNLDDLDLGDLGLGDFDLGPDDQPAGPVEAELEAALLNEPDGAFEVAEPVWQTHRREIEPVDVEPAPPLVDPFTPAGLDLDGLELAAVVDPFAVGPVTAAPRPQTPAPREAATPVPTTPAMVQQDDDPFAATPARVAARRPAVLLDDEDPFA